MPLSKKATDFLLYAPGTDLEAVADTIKHPGAAAAVRNLANFPRTSATTGALPGWLTNVVTLVETYGPGVLQLVEDAIAIFGQPAPATPTTTSIPAAK